MTERKYPMSAGLLKHVEPLTQLEVDRYALNLQGCDAAIVFLLERVGPAIRTTIDSVDGDSDENVSGLDQFKAWVTWADMLSQDPDLRDAERTLCAGVVALCIKAGALKQVEHTVSHHENKKDN